MDKNDKRMIIEMFAFMTRLLTIIIKIIVMIANYHPIPDSIMKGYADESKELAIDSERIREELKEWRDFGDNMLF